MLRDLVLALCVALPLVLLPGYPWARVLSGVGDRAARLAFAAALSLALVPPATIAAARLSGTGVTAGAALLGGAAVLLSGVAAWLAFGPAPAADKPLLPLPAAPLGVGALLPLAGALLAGLGVASGALGGWWPPVVAALLAGAAGALGLLSRGREPELPVSREGFAFGRLGLPAALGLALLWGYSGPVLHDWPFIRGVDHYSHAVMANLMMERAEIYPYLIYPPGFHTMTAAVSRLSGLEPLELFPVLAPAFLLLPALSLYALGRALWGRRCGLAAAFLGGVVLGSPYLYLAEARYPQLISAQFLTVLAVAALFRLLASPSLREGAVLALLGSSVVLYHHVGAYFFALVLAAASLLLLPPLLLRGERRRAAALVLALSALGALSVLYAWDTYDLPRTVAGLLGGGGPGATGEAVAGAIGTQQPFPLSHLPEPVSHPVLWLGLLGIPFALVDRRRIPLAGRLAPWVLLAWCLIMFCGSRTALSGFPERFERDLGLPLALFAAYALVMLLRPAAARPAALAVSALAALLVAAGAARSLAVAAAPAPDGPSDSARLAITPNVEAAGEWLERHNTGGNIIVTPYIDHVPSRALLAMGGYSAVQTFNLSRIERNRDLPPSGKEPPLDAFVVMKRPGSPEARRVLREYDVRYVVLSKDYPGVDWRRFERLPGLYGKTFENEDVAIYAPKKRT